MTQHKKQYPSIEEQIWWEKVLDRITHEESFKFSIILLGIYTLLLLIPIYSMTNSPNSHDAAESFMKLWFGFFPLVAVVAMFNPWSTSWGLRMERKLQQPIKDYVAQCGSCTYDELIVQFMPARIHLGIDDALEQLLRSRELVLEDNRYRLPTNEERRKWHEEWLTEWGVKISFEDLEKVFALELDKDEGDTSIGFSLMTGGKYWIWKGEDEISGTPRFFFSSDSKIQQDFATFQELAAADLFDGQSLRSVWDDAALTFLNDHWDIEEWLRKHLP